MEGPDREPFSTVSDVTAGRDRVLDHLIGFVNGLRQRDVTVPANGPITAAQSLALVGLDDADRARAALRAALIPNEADIDTFEALFPEFWRSLLGEADPDPWTPPEQDGVPSLPATDPPQTSQRVEEDPDGIGIGSPREATAGMDVDSDGTDGRDASEEVTTRAVYSPVGSSRPIDRRRIAVGHTGSTQLAEAVRDLGNAVATRPGRRWARHGSDVLDARRVLRRSVTTGGAVSTLPRVDRARTATHAVMLVDVSQSVLDTIDRDLLLGTLGEAHAQWRRVTTFFFDTEVTEVTDAFETDATISPVAALERAEAEWGGGTRIGSAIADVCARAPPVIDRESVVFIISDGLEMGEVDRLAEAMATLGRRARMVVWLNPLAADPAYEPTCRGMCVAMPHIDGLFAFTAPDDLTEVARQIRQRGPGGRIGYEYDPRRSTDDTAPASA